MARLLFLIILYALPSLVVPIHNSSAGGNLPVFVIAYVRDSVCVCCVCLQYALMDRSNSTEIAKWPEWRAVICAVRKASVKLTIYHVAVIYLHYLETEFSLSDLVSSSFILLPFLFFFRLCHHPASKGWGDPLQRPDTRAGTENAVTAPDVITEPHLSNQTR